VKLSHPAVIGHSMGGTIGLMLAARHPLAISRLMVVDMLPFMGAMFGPPGMPAELVRPIADKILLQMRTAVGDDRIKQIEAVIRGMINNEAERAAAVQDRLNSDTDLVARAFHELVVTDLRPELSRIIVPTTVLYALPNRGPFTPQQFDALYRSAYADLKGATLTRIPNSSHFIMLDAPERFASEVRHFLRPG
ncbi:MAG: alpha/beta fold hydrolase, partial [Burkholderiaceae bacterium]